MIFTRFTVFLIMATAIMAGLLSCGPKNYESTTSSGQCISSGDIIVSNSGSDAVLVLKSDGTYRNIALNVTNTAETVYGLWWSTYSNELIVVVDGADRVMAVSPSDCSSRIAVSDANLNGNLRGITQQSNGDFFIVETNNVEKYSSAGFRITAGGWPKALQTTGTGISANSSGGFVHCSTGTDVVRVYDSSGTQTATRSSGIGATTDAMDCRTLSTGNIATVWSGTTDTVAIYSSDLSGVVATYSDTAILSTPGGVAERSNGNLLIVDRAFHYIVEITSSGSFVQVLGDGVLSTPEYILVVP